MEITKELYDVMKKSVEVESLYHQHSKKGKLIFTCGCGKEVTLNGANSHKTVCELAPKARKKFIVDMFNLNTNCPVCNNLLQYDGTLQRTVINFCSAKCIYVARTIIHKYENNLKICKCCNKQFIAKIKYSKYCSKECQNIGQGIELKNWHLEVAGTDKDFERRRKIGVASSISNKGKTPWNYNLKGDEYLSHYVKDDGSNSLYDALEKNKMWFKQTEPEKIIEAFFKELNVRYKYNFFCSNRQFDFLLSLNNYDIVFEIDGDYWHKSKLRCCDKKERDMCRVQDKLKESVIYKIKSNKEWLVVRFWELDIYNDIDTVKKFITKIITKDNNNESIKDIVCEIKEYYNQKS